MKRRHVWTLVIIILIGTGVYAWDYFSHRLPAIPMPRDARAQTGLAVTPVTLPNGLKIAAEVVRTPRQMARGLMYRDYVPPNTGMLFLYEETKYQQIWMKNVKVDLDIVFIGENKQITYIEKSLKHLPEHTPDSEIKRINGYGKYVLELAAGEADRLGLEKGMLLAFL